MKIEPKPFDPMKQNLFLCILLSSLLIPASTHAQTWETFLPRPDTQEASGTQVLIDPFSANPAYPALLIGPRAENGQVLYMEPLDAASYQTTPMAGSLGAVFRMGFNPADASVYAVGAGQLVTSPPFPRKNPYVWTVQRSTFDSGSQ